MLSLHVHLQFRLNYGIMGLECVCYKRIPDIVEICIQIEKRHKGSANLLTDQSQCAQGRLRDSDSQVFDAKEHESMIARGGAIVGGMEFDSIE